MRVPRSGHGKPHRVDLVRGFGGSGWESRGWVSARTSPLNVHMVADKLSNQSNPHL